MKRAQQCPLFRVSSESHIRQTMLSLWILEGPIYDSATKKCLCYCKARVQLEVTIQKWNDQI